MFGDKFDEMDGGKMRGHEIGYITFTFHVSTK